MTTMNTAKTGPVAKPGTATLIFEDTGLTIHSAPIWLHRNDSLSLPFEILDFKPDSDFSKLPK